MKRFSLLPATPLALFLVMVLLPSAAVSHQGGGDSYLHLSIGSDAMDAKVGLSARTLSQTAEFDDNGDYKVSTQEMQRHLEGIARYVRSRLRLAVGDVSCPMGEGQHEVMGRFAILRFVPKCPPSPRTLTIDYDLFSSRSIHSIVDCCV